MVKLRRKLDQDFILILKKYSGVVNIFLKI
jgi:hypothetical protein